MPEEAIPRVEGFFLQNYDSSAYLSTRYIHSVGMVLLFSFVGLGLSLMYRAVRVVWR